VGEPLLNADIDRLEERIDSISLNPDTAIKNGPSGRCGGAARFCGSAPVTTRRTWETEAQDFTAGQAGRIELQGLKVLVSVRD
jgi:hypothetical protein